MAQNMLGSCRLLRIQRYLFFLLFASFICGMILGISLVTDSDITGGLFKKHQAASHAGPSSRPDIPVYDRHRKQNESKLHQASGNGTHTKTAKSDYWRNRRSFDSALEKDDGNLPPPNYNLHTFYYPWYGSPEKDSVYLHWNHRYIEHWDKNQQGKWPKGRHHPPDDIGASFYPELGPYSSRDPNVMDNHMLQIRVAGIGVLVVSWYPPDQADQEGHPWDDFMKELMDMAHKYDLKISFHIEPYEGRDADSMHRNIEYLMKRYGAHPAFYRRQHPKTRNMLPLLYIYDSYLVADNQWAKILQTHGDLTVRGTALDAIFLGLVVEEHHKGELITAGFDGYYTYFASDGFTYGSSTRNWASLATFARTNKVLFVPSAGPGYDDTRIRPWNHINTKHREHGGYYEQSFKAALGLKPPIIAVTSFNEWGEGTQIERAVPKSYQGRAYCDYSPQRSDYYLMLTRKYSLRYRKSVGV